MTPKPIRRARIGARVLLVAMTVLPSALVALTPRMSAASTETPSSNGTRTATRDSVVEILARAGSAVDEGSGFVIAANRVLTNAHVIGDERAATVRFPDRNQVCPVVRESVALDLALLQCETGDHQALRLAAAARRGEAVVAIGYPGGQGPRITHGVITDAEPNAAGYLATDAALNPGNSGGPIVDAESGEVVGVATAIDTTDRAINFAIPPTTVRRFLAESADADRESGSASTTPAEWLIFGLLVVGFAAGYSVRALVARRQPASGSHSVSGWSGHEDAELRVVLRGEPPEDEDPVAVQLVGVSRPASLDDQSTHGLGQTPAEDSED